MFVDTNIVVYASLPSAVLHDSAKTLLAEYGEQNQLFINDVVFAELSAAFDTVEPVVGLLTAFRIEQVRSTRESLFRAGQAFVEYKRSGGPKTSPLPDFFIGADAETANAPLLTNDVARFQTYFPKLDLITP